jgi:hypothetical protein
MFKALLNKLAASLAFFAAGDKLPSSLPNSPTDLLAPEVSTSILAPIIFVFFAILFLIIY